MIIYASWLVASDHRVMVPSAFTTSVVFCQCKVFLVALYCQPATCAGVILQAQFGSRCFLLHTHGACVWDAVLAHLPQLSIGRRLEDQPHRNLIHRMVRLAAGKQLKHLKQLEADKSLRMLPSDKDHAPRAGEARAAVSTPSSSRSLVEMDVWSERNTHNEDQPPPAAMVSNPSSVSCSCGGVLELWFVLRCRYMGGRFMPRHFLCVLCMSCNLVGCR